MMNKPLHFRHDPQNAIKGVLIFAVVIGLVAYGMSQVPGSGIENKMIPYSILGILLIGALLLFGLCAWGIIDRSPQLTVDSDGITYRVPFGSPRTIGWDRIHSIDLELKKKHTFGEKDTLIVYANTENGQVEAVEIGIGALDGGASDVFSKIKIWRIENQGG